MGLHGGVPTMRGLLLTLVLSIAFARPVAVGTRASCAVFIPAPVLAIFSAPRTLADFEREYATIRRNTSHDQRRFQTLPRIRVDPAARCRVQRFGGGE